MSAAQAFTNARRVIRIERAVALFHEQQIQHYFLRWTSLVEILDDLYNTTHFVVPAVILMILFVKAPDRYVPARNTLAIMTALALVGFAFFPLMPPRLLPPAYHFADTLKTVGGLWSFDSGPVASVSNQYAAMPSLHMGWAAWSAAVAVPNLRRTWERCLAVAYPMVTLFCIIVTANHYFLDAAAGLGVLGIAQLVQRTVPTRVHVTRVWE